MEIAVFSDIHGNYRAFEVCLEYAIKRKINHFIFLGDYLGEFAYPQKTMQLLYRMREQFSCFFIRGNKEDYWLNRRRNVNCDWKDGNHSIYSMNYNFANLTNEDLDFFESLPISRQLDFEGMPPIVICHGSPCNNSEKMLLSNKSFAKRVEDCSCDYILCGHTHIQQLVEQNGKKILNPGAIGVPLHSENGKAQFMLLQAGEGKWKHEFVSLAYNKEEVVRDLHESGLYEKTPYWCQITENLIRTGEVAHGSVLNKAIELCEAEQGSCKWYAIPDKYWEQAIRELIGEM